MQPLHVADPEYKFESNLGAPICDLPAVGYDFLIDGLKLQGTDIRIGNMQCAVAVKDFDFDWKKTGLAIETSSRFPEGTNVCFYRQVGENQIEARFWERRNGATESSGTGSAAASVAASMKGTMTYPVAVVSPGGQIIVRLDAGQVLIAGTVYISFAGEFRWTPFHQK